MSRMIDADALIAEMHNIILEDGEDRRIFYEVIERQPTIEERKKGKWIRNDNGTYSCSLCHSWIPEEQHFYARYCLYCGADMRGGNHETP